MITPGDWKVERGHVGSTRRLFVTAPFKDGILPWSDGDAYLIAAAPDLLRWLKWIARHPGECIGDHPELLEKIRTSIAKAGGR